MPASVLRASLSSLPDLFVQATYHNGVVFSLLVHQIAFAKRIQVQEGTTHRTAFWLPVKLGMPVYWSTNTASSILKKASQYIQGFGVSQQIGETARSGWKLRHLALQKIQQAQEMVDHAISVALFYHDLFHSEVPNFDVSHSHARHCILFWLLH